MKPTHAFAILVATGLAVHASADSVSFYNGENPSVVQSTTASVMGAKYRLQSPGNFDMSLSNRASTGDAANRIAYNLGDSLNNVRWNMTLAYTVGEGFRFDMARESDPTQAFTLAWGDFASLSDDTSAPGLVNEEASLNGRSPTWNAGGMNALRIQIQATSPDPAYMAFEDLAFASTTLGNVSIGDFTANDTNGNGWFWLVADTDMYLHNWTLSGTYVGSGMTGGGESQKIDIHGLEVVVVPLPPAAWAGLGSLGVVVGAGYARRRSQRA